MIRVNKQTLSIYPKSIIFLPSALHFYYIIFMHIAAGITAFSEATLATSLTSTSRLHRNAGGGDPSILPAWGPKTRQSTIPRVNVSL